MERSVFPYKCDGYVQGFAFNSSGLRLAAASADQKIYIWTNEGGWRESASWNAHHGAVYKVRWAPEEFGSLIASCSFDKTIRIWEEKKEKSDEAIWKNLATLVESKEPVVDIRFAPKCYGLTLAACNLSGEVRIYEAMDLLNLALWSCTQTFEASGLGSNCLAWNPANQGQMIVVGNNDLATARRKLGIVRAETEEPVQVWAISQDSKRWGKVAVPKIHRVGVVELDWAPRAGRKVHYIASAGMDGTVAIWRLAVNGAAITTSIEFEQHDFAPVFGVAWDSLGCALVTTSGEGKINVWKRSGLRTWRLEVA